MHLLHARILAEHPTAQVFIHKEWPKDILEPQHNKKYLDENLPGYPSFVGEDGENGELYFLSDEGQTTYWDTALWLAFKDNIQCSKQPVYAILFCSYGNENVSNLDLPTPLVLGDARITLDRTNKGVSEPCGLLLDKKEFRDVISLRGKLRLAEDLRDFVYSFTRGHVGAIVAVVEFLLKKVPTCESRVI